MLALHPCLLTVFVLYSSHFHLNKKKEKKENRFVLFGKIDVAYLLSISGTCDWNSIVLCLSIASLKLSLTYALNPHDLK